MLKQPFELCMHTAEVQTLGRRAGQAPVLGPALAVAGRRRMNLDATALPRRSLLAGARPKMAPRRKRRASPSLVPLPGMCLASLAPFPKAHCRARWRRSCGRSPAHHPSQALKTDLPEAMSLATAGASHRCQRSPASLEAKAALGRLKCHDLKQWVTLAVERERARSALLAAAVPKSTKDVWTHPSRHPARFRAWPRGA